MPEKGAVHLVPLILILLGGLLVAGFLILRGGVVRTPTTQETREEPTVRLTKDYKNPFDKTTQYVNPFSDYKNPFDTLE